MDWNSPTTKKHIAEAEAQGCVLLGSGDKKDYRTYRLACGHEQIVQAKQMRTGGFRCRACLDKQHSDEAMAQGCELLGPGRSNIYRLYRLPCGHEQESQASLIRKGAFACQFCLTEKLRAEAEAQGCELLTERGKRSPGIRRGPYRTYRLPCGHEQDIQPQRMQAGRFRCQTCLNSNLAAEAKAQACVLVGPGRTAYYRTYRLPCGHEQQVGTPAMRDGEFTCQTCLNSKHAAEAKARGCELLGRSATKNFLYRAYRLPCGHEQEITLQHMRLGNFRCHECEEYYYTLPSHAYLLHIKVGADEWLKLGYAKNVDLRTTQYGLPIAAETTVIATKLFDTGKEAREFEGSLHRKHRRKRLRARDMAEFHVSGGTECYPVKMAETLLARFREPE